jgi:ABC-2 type transport system ATP-binding protein
MSNSIITLTNVSKTFSIKQKRASGFKAAIESLFSPHYKTVTAVDNISFSVEEGEFLALIGPNGAGKSTTIKMMTGILTPTKGVATVYGYTPHRQRQRLAYHIGAVFGQRSQLWYHLAAKDSYDLFARIYDLDTKAYQERLDYLVTTFEIGDLLTIPVRKLSLGQRMRCELVASLLHRPKILFLDEPTIGLDVIAKQQVRSILKQLNQTERTTIVLTSHDAGDIEMLTQRTVIINYGTVVFDDVTEQLKKHFITTKIVEFILDSPQSIQWPFGKVIEQTPFSVKVAVDTNNTAIADVMSFAIKHGHINDVNIYDQPLEEIIAAIYRMNKRVS